MGSLANQYISQSYTSLIHLGNNSTASTQFTELEDGLGNGLGMYVNTIGDLRLDGTLSVQNLTVTGAVAIDTYFSASTPAYTNSTQPYFTDTVFVTGSYVTGSYPPSIADVKVGWIGNGINVTNGVVTAVSQSVSGYYITMAGQFPQISQQYTFTGGISAPVTINGDLEISENLIVSGTFDIEGKVVVNDNVRINGDLEVSGSQRNTGSLFVSNAISSSTITGIGNVTAFSQSLWAEFNNLENYTSSLRAAFTASGVDTIFTNNITASNIEVRNNLNVVGTITANKIVTLIESASVIYSSGSNILGDETSDIQTLIGDVIMSGSASLTGSMGISNNLEVKGNISSSTIS
jgi:cytoskeletal protein CcmA (bactofilin family)